MMTSRKRPLEIHGASSGSKPKKLKHTSSDASTTSGTDVKAGNRLRTDQFRKVRQQKLLRKPKRSYLSHLGSIVAYRHVSKAISQSIDPRSQLVTFDDDDEDDDCLISEDVKMTWYFISKEYPDKTLEEILEELKPYSGLTVNPLVREDIKTKYKAEMPKLPTTAYMLFCKSKGPKLKEKHPELTVTEMAKKLGKKWHSLSSERQEKYKQQYALLKKDYDSQMTQFYTDHPDARLSKERSRRTKRKKLNGKAKVKVVLSPEDTKFKELTAKMPKSPTTSYFLYCKEKREKLQKKHPDISSQEITRRLSQKWKSLGDKEKAKYKKIYEEEAKEYNREMDKFYKQNPGAKQFIARYKQQRAQASSSKSSLSSKSYAPAKEELTSTFKDEDEDDETSNSEADEVIDVGTPADCVQVNNGTNITQQVEVESTEEDQEESSTESEDSSGSESESESN